LRRLRRAVWLRAVSKRGQACHEYPVRLRR
jgi:hypothetical protein